MYVELSVRWGVPSDVKPSKVRLIHGLVTKEVDFVADVVNLEEVIEHERAEEVREQRISFEQGRYVE